MSYNNNPNSRNDFNLSKPTFDLFTLRSIRNDALLQYSSLNQSEPLRINIYLLLTITLLSFPTLSEAVIGEEASVVTTKESLSHPGPKILKMPGSSLKKPSKRLTMQFCTSQTVWTSLQEDSLFTVT